MLRNLDDPSVSLLTVFLKEQRGLMTNVLDICICLYHVINSLAPSFHLIGNGREGQRLYQFFNDGCRSGFGLGGLGSGGFWVGFASFSPALSPIKFQPVPAAH